MKTGHIIGTAHSPSFGGFSHLSMLLKQWRARARGRADLATLNADQLRDIGVTAHEAGVEAAKPFWQA